ncbi:MAG: hypothetical protein Q4E12_03430 [Coriobacteriia bacterium]|nr:hypothetical protein [Coriobacteriia bacterium]
MDEATATRLRALNQRFYETTAHGFEKTRHNSWPGWDTLLSVVPLPQAEPAAVGNSSPAGGPAALNDPALCVVTDLACGNWRFETFLERRFPQACFAFQTADSARFEAWGTLRSPLDHKQLDLLGDAAWDFQPAHLVVCFGFMHHVPGQQARLRLLRRMLAGVAPGGFAALSFWRFLEDESLRAKTLPAAEAGFNPAALDPGDAFLGFDGSTQAIRYCHSFTDTDMAQLVEAVAPQARVAARYRADGRTGTLNDYVVFAC